MARLSLVLVLISGSAIVGLMLATSYDVIARKALGFGLPGVVEWSEVLLVIVVFTGMMSAELSGSHIRGASILPRSSRGGIGAAMRCLGDAIGAAVLIWAVVVTSEAAFASYKVGEFREGLSRVPVWPAKLAIPLGLAGFALALVFRAIGQAALIGSRAKKSMSGKPRR
ncbi:MAG: TRAP transporter small permease [Paracoccus sp. (in: a-proteobacteria)]